ncbi:Dual specificity tyrosine-phosphorylation-regulated kinase [Entamoeba marina]
MSFARKPIHYLTFALDYTYKHCLNKNGSKPSPYFDQFGLLMWFKNDIIQSKYQLIKVLGYGTHSCIIQGINLINCDDVAIKFVKHQQLKIPKQLINNNNHHIIDIKECIESPTPMIITELLGPSLFHLINNDPNFVRYSISNLFHDLINTLHYLFDYGIIHCDIKPSNICFDERNNIFKLIDYDNSTTSPCSGQYVQSRYYRSPEIIFNNDWNEQIDIWSVGCVLSECILLEPLFPAQNDKEHILMLWETLGPIPYEIIQNHLEDFPCFVVSNTTVDLIPSMQELLEQCPLQQVLQDSPLLNLILRMLEYKPQERIHIKELLQVNIV